MSRRNSAAKKPPQNELSREFEVGHDPNYGFSGVDLKKLRAYQANLLSLISHELRTPLMGVLNALQLLQMQMTECPPDVENSFKGLKRNAHNLQNTLDSILDIAAIESDMFRVHLREIDLPRIVESRLEVIKTAFESKGVSILFHAQGREAEGFSVIGFPVLGDPPKIARAVELCLAVVHALFQDVKTHLKLEGVDNVEKKIERHIDVFAMDDFVEFRFSLPKDRQSIWSRTWKDSLSGFYGGLGAQAYLFLQALQDENDFLTRKEEGLRNELALVHEIFRRHGGSVKQKLLKTDKGTSVVLRLQLPTLNSEKGIIEVLRSRTFTVSHEVKTVAVVLIKVPDGESVNRFRYELHQRLFRSSDSVYPLGEERVLALLLDDCKIADIPKIVSRIEKDLCMNLLTGFSVTPDDAVDAKELLALAKMRLKKR